MLDEPRRSGRPVVDPDFELAPGFRRQCQQVGARLHRVEALALRIDKRIGRSIIRARREDLFVARGHAHDDVAAEILAGQLVAQRVADEVHPLRKSVALHRQTELARKQIRDPVLETVAAGIGKRQIAGIDAGTKRRARLLRADARAREREHERNRGPKAHCFNSSTCARVISPFDRPFRYAYRLSRLSITVLLVEKLTMPLSSRPSRTVFLKSSLLSVFRLSISEGPTRPC